MAPFDQILRFAEESPIASFRWKDRGVAPRGYVKGMSVVYARVYCKVKASTPAAIDMAKPDTGNPDRDALTWYAALFNDVGMDDHTAGVGTLRHLFVLLVGLGMRESSGRHCEGRDQSAVNVTSDTAEAGTISVQFQCEPRERAVATVVPGLFETSVGLCGDFQGRRSMPGFGSRELRNR